MATAPSSCCLCTTASPKTASARVKHLGNDVMQIVPGFPLLQQVATDASAFDSWVPRHLSNVCSVCILPLHMLAGLRCMLGAWAVPLPNAAYYLWGKNHHRAEKSIIEAGWMLVPQSHRDLSYTLLGSCLTGCTITHIARKSLKSQNHRLN